MKTLIKGTATCALLPIIFSPVSSSHTTTFIMNWPDLVLRTKVETRSANHNNFFIQKRGALGEQWINSSRNMGVRWCVWNPILLPKLKRRLSFLSLFLGKDTQKASSTLSLEPRLTAMVSRFSLRFEFPLPYVLSPSVPLQTEINLTAN